MNKKSIGGPYFQSTQERFSRHQNKKTKKPLQDGDEKELLEYDVRVEGEPLDTIYKNEENSMPGHFELGIWRKNMSLLTRTHLPSYIKLLDWNENEACLIPGRANLNPKKKIQTDILIEDPITQKTRQVAMNAFPILLTPIDIVFYKIGIEKFEKIFKEFPAEDIKIIFNSLVEDSEESTNLIHWPAIVLEGLNDKFDKIEYIISNYVFRTAESNSLFKLLLNYANDQIKKEGSSKIIDENHNSSNEENNCTQNVDAERMVSEVGSSSKREQCETETENNFCIWLIGSSHFEFTRTDIINWKSLKQETIKRMFNNHLCSNLIKETNLIIDSLNKHKKLRESELKADEYKSFIYRLGTYKSESLSNAFCIPLRFENLKGAGKRVLIKVLKNDGNELKWVPTETTTVNYTLPNITRKEMSFFYLCKKMNPFEIIEKFFYREFLYLPQNSPMATFKMLFPQFYMTQQEAYLQRCKACNYVIRAMEFKCCYFCKSFCHEECTPDNRKKQPSIVFDEFFCESEEKVWICEKCQPCTVCSEAVGDDFLSCSTCFSYSHFECGRIKGLEEGESKLIHLKINDKYVCEFCLKCKMCSHKLKDNEYLLIDNDFYCTECSNKIKSNNHCHICMKKKEGNSSMKWIQCGESTCEKWVHEICDPEYTNVVKCPTDSDPYLCPFCRDIQKRKIYSEIIDCISVFDEAQFFTEPSYLDIPLYNTIITEPMCFQIMKEKCMQGKYDVNSFIMIEKEFQLIISNALKFNMPKDAAHGQAKILKVLGEKALDKFKPFFNTDLTSIISGNVFSDIKKARLELHREINTHYLETLLNYKAEKSFVEIKENKRKPNECKLEDELKFRSSEILNNLFRNSTMVFHLQKQKITIGNLFTMPKGENERGIWNSVKGDVCYYHHSKDVIYECPECGESYCCMRECIRHRTCSCGQRECKCDSFECGCPPLKDKERKSIELKLLLKYAEPLKSSKEIIMELTENFKYCLKCSLEKISSRICSSCQSVCSWGYFKCPDCTKVWHKSCYPNLLNVSHISSNKKVQSLSNENMNDFPLIPSFGKAIQNNTPTPTCSIIYCNECLSQHHPNTYHQALSLSAKSKLIKISKITKYIRIFIEVYFIEGIRLTPFQIQQLILENYDQFSIREPMFKEYDLNYSIIERFRDFNFKTNASIERSLSEYVNDFSSMQNNFCLPEEINRHTEYEGLLIDEDEYLGRCRKIWWKYFKMMGSGIYDGGDSEHWKSVLNEEDIPIPNNLKTNKAFRFVSLCEIKQKIIFEAYTCKDRNSHFYETLNNSKLIADFEMRIQSSEEFLAAKEKITYINSLSYIPTITSSFYEQNHRYRFTLIYSPRAMPFYYEFNSTFKKKSNLEEMVRSFLLGIYEESKFCLRKGTTCIVKYNNGGKESKEYWSVLKKFGKGKKEILVTLQRKMGLWFVKIDNYPERIVSEIEDICNEINKCSDHTKLNSFKELGEFLGFTVFEPFYKANHFTNFLQTNLVDEMPLLDKMNRITELYESFNWGENGVFTKQGPASFGQIGNELSNEKTITFEYSITKIKPQYLTRKPKMTAEKFNKKLEKRFSSSGGELDSSQTFANSSDAPIRKHSFITFEDLKRFLIDTPVPNPNKSEISLKNNQILNEVFIAPSKIHKLGLFSRKFLKKHSIVIEYIGEIVSESIADLREKKFHYGCYLFSILKENHKENQDKKDIIDATFRGNMARYLNHSCDPNCKARTEYVNGSPRIIIYTIRDIQQFEEITYDYQFNVDAVEKLECSCGAKNCQGRLN